MPLLPRIPLTRSRVNKLPIAIRHRTVELLGDRSPKLRTAPAAAKHAGHAYVVIDGTLMPIDRVAADRPFYADTHRRGMNRQVIPRPDGQIMGCPGNYRAACTTHFARLKRRSAEGADLAASSVHRPG